MDHRLANVLTPVLVLGVLGTVIILFTRVITDYILRKKMIDKGFVNDDTQSIFQKRESLDNRHSALKWGLIIFFAGFSLILMEYLPYNPESPLPYGLFTVSVSLGFLIYYFIMKQKST